MAAPAKTFIPKDWALKRVLLVGLLLTTLYVGYAAYCVFAFASAVQSSDDATVSAHIDFPSVRASLKEQLVTVMLSAMPTHKDSSLATGLAVAFAPALAGNMVDGYVSPSGIAMLLNKKKQEGRVQEFDIPKFFRHVSVSSPTKFSAFVKGPAGSGLDSEDGLRVTVRFEDWTWKISDIRFPATYLKDLKDMVTPVNR